MSVLGRSLLLLLHILPSFVRSTEQPGGWASHIPEYIPKIRKCNIDIKDFTLTNEEFLHRYAYQQPLIIRGNKLNQDFRQLCSRNHMLDNFGDKKIRLSSANTYSYRKVDVTLHKYVTEILSPQKLDTLGNETLYWFGDNNYTEWEAVFAHYKQPPYNLPHYTAALSFGLAGAGTGVPFHFHGPGFGEVIYGKKHWFLFPPEARPMFEPDYTTLHWYIYHYPQLPQDKMPLECTLEEGDVIYFPDRWWHATLNLNTAVFISTFLAKTY